MDEVHEQYIACSYKCGITFTTNSVSSKKDIK